MPWPGAAGGSASPPGRPQADPWVHLRADGVYLQARMESRAERRLVVIGAAPEGRKELAGFQVGTRNAKDAA